jgi:hypothetical protein
VVALIVLIINLGVDPSDYMYITYFMIVGIFTAIVGAWGLAMIWAPDEWLTHLTYNLGTAEEIDESETDDGKMIIFGITSD